MLFGGADGVGEASQVRSASEDTALWSWRDTVSLTLAVLLVLGIPIWWVVNNYREWVAEKNAPKDQASAGAEKMPVWGWVAFGLGILLLAGTAVVNPDLRPKMAVVFTKTFGEPFMKWVVFPAGAAILGGIAWVFKSILGRSQGSGSR